MWYKAWLLSKIYPIWDSWVVPYHDNVLCCHAGNMASQINCVFNSLFEVLESICACLFPWLKKRFVDYLITTFVKKKIILGIDYSILTAD